MIKDTLAKIESTLKTIETADPKKKTELIRLLGELKGELARIDSSHAERAAGVATFADAAAFAATRRVPSPKLTRLALDALAASAEEFERTHPALVRVVNEICRELAGIGI